MISRIITRFILPLVLLSPFPLLAQETGRIEVTGEWRSPYLGHGREVTCIAYSANGRWLASGDEGGEVLLWDRLVKKPRRLSIGTSRVEDIDFSPDGMFLAGVDSRGYAAEWATASGQRRLHFRASPVALDAIVYLPSGKKFATAGQGGNLNFWDRNGQGGYSGLVTDTPMMTGTMVKAIPPGSPAKAAGLALREVILAVDGRPLRTDLGWMAATGGHPSGKKLTLKVRAPGQQGSRDVELTLAPPPRGETIPLLSDAFPSLVSITSLKAVVAPDRIVATHVDGHLSIWTLQAPVLGVEGLTAVGGKEGLLVNDVVPGSPADRAGIKAGDQLLKAGEAKISSAEELKKIVAGTAVGSRISITVGRHPESGEGDFVEHILPVILDRVGPREIARSARLHARPIKDAIVLAGAKLIFTQDGQDTHKVDMANLVPSKLTHQGSPPVSMATLPGGKEILLGTADGTLLAFDPASGKGRTICRIESIDFGLIAVDPAGKELAWEQDLRIRRLNLDTGTEIDQGDAPAGPFHLLGITSDGRRIVAASPEGKLWLWEGKTGSGPVMLGKHDRKVIDLAIHPEGRLAATVGEDDTIRLWDLDTRGERVLIHQDESLNSISFSGDGTLLVATRKYLALVWSMEEILKDRSGGLVTGFRTVEDGYGLKVAEVLPFAAFVTEKLEAGDRLLAIDGVPVGTEAKLREALQGKRPGDRVRLGITRSPNLSRQVELTLVLEPSRVNPTKTYNDSLLMPVDAAFSPSRRYLWILGGVGKFRSIDMTRAKKPSKKTLEGVLPRTLTALDDDDSFLVHGPEGAAIIEASTGKLRTRLNGGKPIQEVGYSSKLLFMLSREGTLTVSPLGAPDEVIGSHRFGAHGDSLAVSSDLPAGVVALSDHGLVAWRFIR